MYKIIISLILVVSLVFGCCSVPSSAALVLDDWAIIGVVSSLVLLCGLQFTDYQSASSFASDLWDRIQALPDLYGDLISGLQGLVVDTYDSFSNVVSVTGDLLNDFVVAVESLYDVSLYPVLESPSISFDSRFCVPVMQPIVYSSSATYYQVDLPVPFSALHGGLNLLYSSVDGNYNIYIYKEDDSFQVIGQIDDYYFRLTGISESPSSADSIGLLFSFSNSSGSPVTLSEFIGSGWQSVSTAKSYISVIPAFFSSGSIVGSVSGLTSPQYSTDEDDVVGSNDRYVDFVSDLYDDFIIMKSPFYRNDVFISFESIDEYRIPFSYSGVPNLNTFLIGRYNFFLLIISLAMGLPCGIGTVISSEEIPIYDTPVFDSSDDNLLDILIPMSSFDILYPSNVNSPDNVLPDSAVDLVVSDLDVPDNPPVDPDDPDRPLPPVILDVDTSGILHYISDFFESIGDFFSFLFSLIGSLPTSLTYPIFGAFLLLVMIGIIIICL